MKKFNRGFTVVEIATAMAIVGVIAAITVPMLSKNIQKHVYATTLARTVEQIELGCQNLLEYENSKRKDGSSITMLSEVGGDLMKKLAPFIGFTESDGNNSSYANNIKYYAYIPTYNLGTPAYAAVSPNIGIDRQNIQNIETIRSNLCDNSTFDLSDPTSVDRYIEYCDGGGGGGGGTPATPSTPVPVPEPDPEPIPKFPETPKKPIIVKPWIPVEEDPPKYDPQEDPWEKYKKFESGGNPSGNGDSEKSNVGSAENKTYISNSGKHSFHITESYNAEDASSKVFDFIIDANGAQNKPNMYGKDVFKFELLNNGKVKPFGNADNCKTGAVGNGTACAARVVADGWKIKY